MLESWENVARRCASCGEAVLVSLGFFEFGFLQLDLPEIRSKGGGQALAGAEGLPLPGLMTIHSIVSVKVLERSHGHTFFVLLRWFVYDCAVF